MSILNSIIDPMQRALAPDPDTTYGNVLPIKRGPDGSLGYALPNVERNALLGLLQAPKDIWSAVTAPGDVYSGAIGPSQGADAMTKGALWAAGGDLAVGPKAAGDAVARSIPAWHGTPYTFEPVDHNPFGEFRDQAIGSGEGAQAYGFGHYVAGNQKVAESYKKAGGWSSTDWEPNEGNLYQVSVKPDEHELLDWDATRSGQSPQVQKALSNIRPSLIPDDPTSAFSPHFTGNDIYQWLQDNHMRLREQYGLPGTWDMRPDEVASKALHQAGVPGIKYLDRGSRAQGSGTSNYVIFHPSNLTITHRNGVGLEPIEGNPFGEQP